MHGVTASGGKTAVPINRVHNGQCTRGEQGLTHLPPPWGEIAQLRPHIEVTRDDNVPIRCQAGRGVRKVAQCGRHM